MPGVGRAARELEVDLVLEERDVVVEDLAQRVDDPSVPGVAGEDRAEIGDRFQLADHPVHAILFICAEIIPLPLDAPGVSLRLRRAERQDAIRLFAQDRQLLR